MKNFRILSFFVFLFCVVSVYGQPSRVITDTIHSDILGVDRPVSVYLPKNFDRDSTFVFPVLYLLHGMYGNNNSWYDDMRAKDVLDRMIDSEMIDRLVVITPYAGGRDAEKEQNGYFNMPGWSYEDFFFTEFLPEVEKRYRAGGERTKRSIAGLSMGGGGAVSYAQRHPDMFVASYGASGVMELPQADEMKDNPKIDPENKVIKYFKSIDEYDCVEYVRSADDQRKDSLRTVRWFLDCGDDDFLLDTNINLTRAMREARIPVQFRVRDGAHDSEYWHTALYEMLPFVDRSMK